MSKSRDQYIAENAEHAMEQMRRYGIPASITLAQGIIESADGKSTLANTANNHFGVKGTYNGNYVLADDDRPNEKFKKYDSVAQSYEDHSKVLMANRYQKYVGNLAHDDYKGWANGIKKGGYASDPNYTKTIVSVIEKNNLQKYDQQVMQQMQSEGRQFGTETNPLSTSTPTKSSTSQSAGYSMPVKRDEFMLVTSPYGEREDPINKGQKQIHHGIDIKTKKDDVLATENNGKVIAVDPRTTSTGGKTVVVEYEREDGSKTQVQYMHLSDIAVKQGDTVQAGQKLGVSGNTGTRTTGEHLHLGVINVAADGKKQWVDPAVYLANISQKGNLTIEAQYNGQDLLAKYKTNDNKQSTAEAQTPQSWLGKLLGCPDAALDNDNGILGGLMQMLMSLLGLALSMENKSKEEKMQAVSDALINKRIDLSSFVPNQKSAILTINDQGNAVLTVNDGQKEHTHELTEAEKANLSNILHSDADDATKQQRVGTIVNTITFSIQAANNYDEIVAQQQSQEQGIKR